MRHYIITWSNGTKESIYGINYTNALHINGITPKMAEDIVEYMAV